MFRLLCEGPAMLAGLHKRKGMIQKGYDADFVIWDPQATFQVGANIPEYIITVFHAFIFYP